MWCMTTGSIHVVDVIARPKLNVTNHYSRARRVIPWRLTGRGSQAAAQTLTGSR